MGHLPPQRKVPRLPSGAEVSHPVYATRVL
jgi:hypothetical protein